MLYKTRTTNSIVRSLLVSLVHYKVCVVVIDVVVGKTSGITQGFLVRTKTYRRKCT